VRTCKTTNVALRTETLVQRDIGLPVSNWEAKSGISGVRTTPTLRLPSVGADLNSRKRLGAPSKGAGAVMPLQTDLNMPVIKSAFTKDPIEEFVLSVTGKARRCQQGGGALAPGTERPLVH
jgi:hypothetical protein